MEETSGRAERMKEVFQAMKGFEAGALFAAPSPLAEAVLAKDLREVERLLDAGADVNEKGFFGASPLLDAAQYAGADEKLKSFAALLAGKKPSVDILADESGSPPLPVQELLQKTQELASRTRERRAERRRVVEEARRAADDPANDSQKGAAPEDMELIRLLIDRGANLEAQDNNGWTPLHRSAGAGAVQVANLLLDAGAEIDARSEDGSTPLMTAATERRVEMVRLLLERGADPLAVTRGGRTPLHSAAQGGSRRIVRMMLDHGADVNAAAEDGTTAALTAAMQGFDDVVEMLRAAGARATFLEAVVLGDANEAERLALDGGLTSDVPSWGRGVMLWAARESRPDVIRLLHTHGVSADAEGPLGSTPMMIGSVRGDAETLQALIECGARPARQTSTPGMSPLQWAATVGDVEKIRILLAGGADVNEETEHGDTPLTGAVMSGNVEAARILLEAGADPNRGGMGMTITAFPAMSGNTEMLRLLVEHGAELSSHAAAGERDVRLPVTLLPGVTDNPELMAVIRTASGLDLFEAARVGDDRKVIALLEAGRDVNGKHDGGQTPLRAATEGGHPETVRLLLEHGADANLADMIGRTPLHCAIQHGRLEIAALLVEHGGDLNAGSQIGLNPLLTAALNQREDSETAARWLIERGARIGLQEAAALGDSATLRNLLDLGRSADEQNEGGLTALMMAAATGRLELTEVLLVRHAAIDLRDSQGSTALTWAFSRGHGEEAKLLLDYGADPNGAAHLYRDQEEGEDFQTHHTPLQAALLTGKKELVELALERGADIHQRGLMGQTAMHMACYLPEEQLELIDLLLSHGANIDAPEWSGDTPLMLATRIGKAAAVKCLLDRGADPTLRNRVGETALGAARAGTNSKEILPLLEVKG